MYFMLKMADVAESAAFTDPATAISHGKRHLLVRDYTMAVTALAQACQLLAEKHGDTADELGEPYLLYGRALLGLAREEAGVLGGGVPGTEETEEDDEEDEEEAEDEKLSNIDEKEDEESEDHTDNGTVSDEKEKTAIEDKAEDSKADQESKKPETEQKEEKIESNNEKQEVEKSEVEESVDKTEDNKISKQTIKKPEKEDEEKPAAGSSKDISHANGPSCSSDHNGDVKKNGENDGEDIGNEDEEDEVNNLQVCKQNYLSIYKLFIYL